MTATGVIGRLEGRLLDELPHSESGKARKGRWSSARAPFAFDQASWAREGGRLRRQPRTASRPG